MQTNLCGFIRVCGASPAIHHDNCKDLCNHLAIFSAFSIGLIAPGNNKKTIAVTLGSIMIRTDFIYPSILFLGTLWKEIETIIPIKRKKKHNVWKKNISYPPATVIGYARFTPSLIKNKGLKWLIIKNKGLKWLMIKNEGLKLLIIKNKGLKLEHK